MAHAPSVTSGNEWSVRLVPPAALSSSRRKT
jgi:hypothetical protein